MKTELSQWIDLINYDERVNDMKYTDEQLAHANEVMALDYEKVDSYLDYDHDTGDLTWISHPFHKCKNGMVAGYIRKYERLAYKEIRIGNKVYKAHRVVWLLHYGAEPDGYIDHIDGDGLNNRISNLRIASNSINQRNSKKRKDNRSGYTGVGLHKGRWIARLRVNGKSINLGSYKTQICAVYARHYANAKYGFTERHGA